MDGENLHCGVNAYGNANKANGQEQLNVSNRTESFIAMLDKPMTRSETESNVFDPKLSSENKYPIWANRSKRIESKKQKTNKAA